MALDAAVQTVSREGKILVVGDYKENRATFPWNTLLHREMELIGSNASAGAWPEAVKLATRRAIPLQYLLTHELPYVRFAEGIDLMRRKDQGLVKLVLQWE
jgi:threonine dehydrogenase-like Zn-dependent dehydrogenase